MKALPPVRAEDRIQWRLGLDAVSHVGGGPIRYLDRIAAQLEGRALFGDNLARTLETLGHIEFMRDLHSGAPAEWEIAPPTLVGMPDNTWRCTGFRSDSVVAAIEDTCYDLGTSFERRPEHGGPDTIAIGQLTSEQQSALVAAMSAAADQPAAAVPDAARAITNVLGPITALVDTLHVEPPTGARSAERWNPLTCRFHPVRSLDDPGAFRISRFARKYVFRTEADVDGGVVRVADARVVKHLAAVQSGLPLIGYDDANHDLYVPLGADLPGLWGRAAALCAAQAPIADQNERILHYRHVPPDVAARLATLLST
jgi:hypothetical protein